jgi:hypothetical protein
MGRTGTDFEDCVMKRLLITAVLALAVLGASHSTAHANGGWVIAFCYKSPCGIVPSFETCFPIPFTGWYCNCGCGGDACYTAPQVGDAMHAGGGYGGYDAGHGFMGAAGSGGSYPPGTAYQAPHYWYDH